MPSSDSHPETGTEERKKLLLVVTDRDIVFNCPKCRGELVVDRDGAGMEVPCSHCGQPLIVPPYQARTTTTLQPAANPVPRAENPPPVSPTAAVAQSTTVPPAAPPPKRAFDHAGQTPEQLARRLDELKHQLKENRSQDTEMRGHVNRATMELHRLQLRLKKLQERQEDIQAELGSIQAILPGNP